MEINLLICKERDDKKTHKNENHWLMRGPLSNQGGDLLNPYMNTIIYIMNITSIRVQKNITEFLKMTDYVRKLSS